MPYLFFLYLAIGLGPIILLAFAIMVSDHFYYKRHF